MRVVQVDPLAFTTPYDDKLSAALARRGHDVHLLTSRFLHGPTPEPRGYEREEVFVPLSSQALRRWPRARARVVLKGLEYPPSVARARRRLGALDPDVVHVQWLVHPKYDRRWLRQVASSRPTVFTAHEVLPPRSRDHVEAWLDVFRSVARIVVHARSSAERLVDLGVEQERIVEIAHPAFEGPVGEPVAAPQGATLLFFGLIRDYKGLDVLIEALPEVARAVPGARLVVAGDALDPVEPLRALAERLEVADRIDWRLGFVPQDEIPGLMEAATIVVLPYRRIEASGVFGDAIGHCRPVVVSDVGVLGETVRRFAAGEVVPPGDPAALAAACIRLLTDPSLLAAAFAGVEAARKVLTWDSAAEAHERLYAEIVGR